MDDENSILLTIKKMIGIAKDYEQFDVDLIVHINNAFITLSQIGSELKPYRITNKDNSWSEYVSIDNSELLDAIKTYVYLKTKLVFDPPTSSIVIETYKQVIKELEFRIQLSSDN